MSVRPSPGGTIVAKPPVSMSPRRAPTTRSDVGVAETLAERRVDPEPEVAGVAAASRCRRSPAQRQDAATGMPLASHQRASAAPASAVHGCPPTTTSGRSRALEQTRAATRARRRRARPARARTATRRGTSATLGEHVLRQGEHDRAGSTGGRDAERAGDELGDPLDLVDLRDPLRERAEDAPVVELLKGLALDVAHAGSGRRAGSAASRPGRRCARRRRRGSRPGRA